MARIETPGTTRHLRQFSRYTAFCLSCPAGKPRSVSWNRDNIPRSRSLLKCRGTVRLETEWPRSEHPRLGLAQGKRPGTVSAGSDPDMFRSVPAFHSSAPDGFRSARDDRCRENLRWRTETRPSRDRASDSRNSRYKPRKQCAVQTACRFVRAAAGVQGMEEYPAEQAPPLQMSAACFRQSGRNPPAR